MINNRFGRKLLLLAVLLGLTAAGTAFSSRTEYRIDSQNSSILFRVKHLGFNTVEGRFTDFSGRVTFDPDRLQSFSVTADILLAGLETGNSMRDRDLKGDSYFSAERFPRIIFSSNSARRLSNGMIAIRGDLTIRNVTREVILTTQVEGHSGGNIRFSAQTEIKRQDFNVSGGGFLIGDTVRITLDILAKPVS